jgi:tRNA-Thr(GGU) m(6)t(6)A37 methyltransferase TsaA
MNFNFLRISCRLIKFYSKRSQLNTLNHVHRKEIEAVRNILKGFKCGECSVKEPTSPKKVEKPTDDLMKFSSIGYVKTIFKEKRAIPRQASVAETIQSKLEINKDLFSNPELSLESLDEFSHFWIIYNFHKNEAHAKPKVYPPRLEGNSVGVFATRSPHRPNLIGMSLVKLDRVEGTTIYFYGTDMLDGTPVLDIKPYIPKYDSPQKIVAAGCNSSNGTPIKTREDPDGEENENAMTSSTSSVTQMNSVDDDDVKVPDWINENKYLKVIFSETSQQQVKELNVNQRSIEEILQSDPRSVYVREKYLSQIYNFQIDGKNVMCKFDDKIHSVTVLQVKKLMDMNED